MVYPTDSSRSYGPSSLFSFAQRGPIALQKMDIFCRIELGYLIISLPRPHLKLHGTTVAHLLLRLVSGYKQILRDKDSIIPGGAR